MQSSHSDFTLVEQTSITLSVSLSPMEIGINHSPFLKTYDYVLTTDASESGAGATIKERKQDNQNLVIPVVNNSRTCRQIVEKRWSDTISLSSVRTTLETMPQEESELDWREYSRIILTSSPAFFRLAMEQRCTIISWV
ncbi:hypothetical protein ACTFIW_003284 [Dictyostelium discoideum]